MGKLIERALLACGVTEVPVRTIGDLERTGSVWHCGLLVEYDDGRFEGRIYSNDLSARDFMRNTETHKSSGINRCMMLDVIPTEWYKMI